MVLPMTRRQLERRRAIATTAIGFAILTIVIMGCRLSAE